MLVYETMRQVTASSRYYRSRVKRMPDGLLNLLCTADWIGPVSEGLARLVRSLVPKL
jgi:hypothetical protein